MSNLGFMTLGDDSQKRPDFSKMSETDLRAYVLAHRQDQSAFYAYIDRMHERPPIAVIEPEEWSEERMQEAIDGAKGRS
jgi:hypothetical protein